MMFCLSSGSSCTPIHPIISFSFKKNERSNCQLNFQPSNSLTPRFFTRHPVIPPEICRFRYLFRVQSYRTSVSVFGCLGSPHQPVSKFQKTNKSKNHVFSTNQKRTNSKPFLFLFNFLGDFSPPTNQKIMSPPNIFPPFFLWHRGTVIPHREDPTIELNDLGTPWRHEQVQLLCLPGRSATPTWRIIPGIVSS